MPYIFPKDDTSNLKCLWRINPDFVKLHGTVLDAAVNDDKARRSLPKLVDLIHQTGSGVVIQGVGTPRASGNRGAIRSRIPPGILPIETELRLILAQAEKFLESESTSKRLRVAPTIVSTKY
ncbi:MAG: hypothetical protein ACXWTN_09485 [Methylosarcina sp.]